MSVESRFLAEPFTRTAAGVFGEMLIATDNAAPAVEADCNVNFATVNERAPRAIAIMGRISGTAEAAADVVLKWRCYHWRTGQFYTAATLRVTGSAGVTSTLGNIWVINHNPQCQKGHMQVIGLQANQVMNLIVDVVEA